MLQCFPAQQPFQNLRIFVEELSTLIFFKFKFYDFPHVVHSEVLVENFENRLFCFKMIVPME